MAEFIVLISYGNILFPVHLSHNIIVCVLTSIHLEVARSPKYETRFDMLEYIYMRDIITQWTLYLAYFAC